MVCSPHELPSFQRVSKGDSKRFSEVEGWELRGKDDEFMEVHAVI